MKKYIPILILCISISVLSCSGRDADKLSARISIYKENPNYFYYKDKPLLLLGGSDEDNLFNYPELMKKNIQILHQVGGNYLRCTMSSRDEGNVKAFLKNNDGKYDLNEMNPDYWSLFEKFLELSRDFDMIVQVEIWATHDFYGEHWLDNPFNPKNNVNYTEKNTKLKSAWPDQQAHHPQPYFHTVDNGRIDSVTLTYQQKFVDTLLSISLNYGNVLYCIDNETRAPADWAWYWANYIQQQSKAKKKEILITEMWDSWNLKDEIYVQAYGHPGLFAYLDISQNNLLERGIHYENILWLKSTLERYGGARPLTNVKVYHSRIAGRYNEPLVGLDRWWQNIFAGCAGTRFHRPDEGTGLNEISQRAIESARIFTDQFDIFSCAPHPELLSIHNSGDVYCLAAPGRLYGVYFPMGGTTTLRIENPDRDLKLRWFNPENGEFLDDIHIDSKVIVELNSPDTLHPWLVLIKKW
ncbi:hypothetical protein JXB12_04830 [candidate division KSB1 bacterium]|nr:hypothetical protein [candidate division KSB1 bacterium]